MTVRATYGMLDFFGDVGGLLDGLYYLTMIVFMPFWKFSYKSHLLNKLFRAGPERENVKQKT